MSGSLTRYSTVTMSRAVRIGGGISGLIGRATGESAAINREEGAVIDEFWLWNGAV